MKQDIIAQLSKLRATSPLIQNITNFVVMNNTANAVLAIGASPMMVHAHKEAQSSVAIASALVINIGTLDDYWAESMILAASKAHEIGKPWILDPVGAGLSTFRNDVLERLISFRPTVIRGNASEIMSLETQASHGKGVDSANSSDQALDAAKWINKNYGSIVCISGEIDYVVTADNVFAIKNGHPLMTKVTGLGCSATAVTGAFLGLNENPLLETLAGISLFSLAGELAQEKAKGPGTLQMELLDALYLLDEKTINERLKIEEING